MATPTLFMPSYDISPGEARDTPRFSHLLTSILGSPFLTTSDLPPEPATPRSPRIYTGADQVDNSQVEMEAIDGAFSAVPRSYTVTRPPSPTPSFRTETFSIINWNAEIPNVTSASALDDLTPRCSTPFRPSNGRRTFSGYPSAQFGSSNTPASPGVLKSSRSLSISIGILPRLWDALRDGSPGKKGKRRPGLPTAASWREAAMKAYSDDCVDGFIDYINMQPLDGEEGELIDDEACFIDVRAVTGVDIVALLPTELALHLLSFLDLSSILSCLRVSKTWHDLADDNSIWRELFARRQEDGWNIDLRRACQRRPSTSRRSRTSFRAPAPLEIDWYELYQTRTELDRRWYSSPHASLALDDKESKAWEPRVRRISGHSDSVYCLEFDSSRIITGSRDRTIKVWSLKTGKCLATFAGHRGSVLCLKFDKDWDLQDQDGGDNNVDVARKRRGFLVSGSSDCTICVWDMYTGSSTDEGEEPEVAADVRAVLRGHTGGVLDLRIDGKWIVSCSKDALIRVWDRKTLALHCTFRGHDGPVNAVGLQGDRVVSASGDGKMMLWDIAAGERLRTFEGHDRGLACIEFKDDLIVSGSNDCKIKVWSASTGTCLRTLVGHDLLVRALSFDPRSGRLVSGSYDKSVKVWDLRTGKMVREFRGCHISHIFDVKFDHCHIVSTSHDQKIVVLDFSEGLDASLFA